MALFSYNNNTLFKVIAIPTIWVLFETQLGIWYGTNQFFSLLRYFIIVSSTILLLRYTYNNHQKISLLQYLFLIWIAYMYVAAIPTVLDSYREYFYFKQFISIYFFLYLLPLLMIVEFDTTSIRKLMKFSYSLSMLYVCIAIPIFYASQKSIFSESIISLLGGAGLVLMTFPYHNEKKSRRVMFSVVLGIVLMMLLGRRNKVLYLSSMLFFAGLLNMFGSSTLKTKKNFRGIFVIFALACFLGLVIFSSSFEFFFSRVDTGMDSREGIIELFILDFNATPNDWIFGRGIYGEFNGGVLAANEGTGMRYGIENGYLNIILKGGGVWLVLLILLSLKSVYLGIFKSNNKLCKGLAFVILVYYIDMIGFGVATISLGYIMVFIAISICCNKQFRKLTDEDLMYKIGLE